MKNELKIVMVLAFIVAAIVGCAPIATHGDSEDMHESNQDSHGSNVEAHGNEAGSNASHGSDAKQAETSQPTEIGAGQFPTVGFEERIDVAIPFSSTEVCPLFEPAGRFLMYDWWEPTVLRDAEGETLEGLLMAARGFNLDILLEVTEHIPDEGQIQYIVLWDDFELQRIDITCVAGETADSTNIVWNERNAGLHANGVSLVTAFVEGGNIGALVERYAQNATQYLEDN